jgi:NADH-quinone oxidoreductase subunit N
MNNGILNLIPASPEILMMVMACVILMVGVFVKESRLISHILAQFTLVAVAALSFYNFYYLYSNTIYAYHNQFVIDRLSIALQEFIFLAVFVTFAYSRHYNIVHRLAENEFYVLGLLSTLGMMVLVSSHNLLTLLLGMELMSLPIYAMVAFARGKERAIEAAMKYFVIGSLATGMMMYGMSFIFGLTKSLDFTQIANAIALIPPSQSYLIVFALIFLIAGAAFKLGAVPFHMWAPDVYDGSPNSVTLFLSAAPKIAAFGLLIRLFVEAMPSLHAQWSEVWIAISIASIVLGNIAAIVQTNIKRMLAYSSIAHMGYMLLGLICATPRGYSAAMFYILSYTLMTLCAFGMITIMSHDGFEANEIKDFAGLNNRNPWLAFMLMMVMFSMAGIPPLVGFIAKLGVLEVLIQAHLTWLAILAVLFAIIGSYY